jgi:hypothetical protein
MTTTECRHCDELSAAIEAAHQRALDSLADPATPDLEAVSWLAAHLAAVEAVVEPLVRRHGIASGEDLREQQRVNHRLQHELRTLEQAVAGDALAARVDVAACRDRIIAALAEHASGEHLLLDRLGREIGSEQAALAAARYGSALGVAPTRPHPHLHPALPVVGRVVRRVAGLRDRVLDVVDGRRNPLPREPRRRTEPGRWGHYLLGTPFEERSTRS